MFKLHINRNYLPRKPSPSSTWVRTGTLPQQLVHSTGTAAEAPSSVELECTGHLIVDRIATPEVILL
ncbi:hypothetical protein NP233_g3875 [Leucocoprinus birnbaumii]|uniref:Uncharacterized protein n=1 Tax=Leucocoprinus birnbaumii TaxID=56174 RepID=A0AAD5VZI2_9AGAR|nr:hypothetical protein NP233_g6945 [Leucocoprinus birnbaumii]KAJ3571258.1 hypothetical protein NP233_g3875 [Leucocoprinus birnbaumii]